MNNSRTYNSLLNFTISLIIQAITLIVTFINRTYFIHILNADYLGINGLFTNILTILSFTELGLGSAIIYSMYKPVQEDNIVKIAALFNFYKSAYRIISVTIFILGILITPLLPNIISEEPAILEDIKVIYILFLVNTVASYSLAYTKSLFTVYQKEYVNVLIERISHIICVIFQIIFLYITHNYIGYLLIQIVATITGNIIIYFWCNRKFKNIVKLKKEKLEKFEFENIFENIKSMMFYKVGSIVLNATDNIIISKILNISLVGISSNYIFIVNTIESIISKALNSIVASIGNLNASNSVKVKEKVFKELNFCVYWLYGFCSIELSILLNKVIIIWIGNEYLINNYWSVLAIILNFYIFGTNFVPSNYRVTMGYFKEARFTPIYASLINIILSVFLGKYIGLFGIYIATSFSRLVTFGIVDPVTILRKGLNLNPLKFYINQIKFFIITIINGLICYYIINIFKFYGFFGLLLNFIIIALLSNTVYFIIYFRTEEFKSVKLRFIKLGGSIKKWL